MVIEFIFFNFNIKCDLFVFLKRFYIKFIYYKFRLFITKQIDIDNIFLNNNKVKRLYFYL